MNEISAAIPSHLLADPKDSMPKVKNTMGKDDFMKLLMAQLQNQDPMKPVDHHEFVAQLAQFGSLEQLSNIHKGIEGLQTGMGDGSKLSALGMIGKKIEATGSSLDLMEGQLTTMRYTRKEGLTPVKAQIYTEGGKMIREMDFNAKSDTEGIKWDGKDSEGKSLPSGKYTFRVQGIDATGQSQELGTELSGRVTGVEIDGKTPLLIVQTGAGTTRVDLSKVRNVSVDEGAPAANKAVKAGSLGLPGSRPAAASSAATQPPADAESNANSTDEPAAGAIASTDELDRLWKGMPNFGIIENLNR